MKRKTLFSISLSSMSSIMIMGMTAFAIPLKIDPKQSTLTFGSLTVPTTGIYSGYDPPLYYTSGSYDGFVYIDPRELTYLNEPTDNFKKVFFKEYPRTDGWDLRPWDADKLSDDSLIVHTYAGVHGKPTAPTATSVGAEFHVRYEPHGNDPKTDLHWIQVITDNHKWNAQGGQHGVDENKVDNDNPTLFVDSPYYDEVFTVTADLHNFYDLSSRPDDKKEHNWHAELFLVSGPGVDNPGPITYFGGIEWGWGNYVVTVPEPSSVLLLGSGLAGLWGLRKKFKK